jgi:hypothetical protein
MLREGLPALSSLVDFCINGRMESAYKGVHHNPDKLLLSYAQSASSPLSGEPLLAQDYELQFCENSAGFALVLGLLQKPFAKTSCNPLLVFRSLPNRLSPVAGSECFLSIEGAMQ